MPKIIDKPSIIKAAGTKEKIIKEYFGAVNSGDRGVSIAIMKSPDGWLEPGQTPEFDEYTVVLGGVLHIQTKEGEYDIKPGEAIMIRKGEWVRYSSPNPEGASYVAVCLPAFTPDSVHRDED
jgi:mannose-6-phosphate isomerase-like protein (cupin superfamily)